MKPERVLRLLKGSRRSSRCRACRQAITWAICAPRGKSVPLVARPFVLREERNPQDVVFEVVGGDQVHRCPARASRRVVASDGERRRARHAERESAWTPDRFAELRAAINRQAAQTGRV